MRSCAIYVEIFRDYDGYFTIPLLAHFTVTRLIRPCTTFFDHKRFSSIIIVYVSYQIQLGLMYQS